MPWTCLRTGRPPVEEMDDPVQHHVIDSLSDITVAKREVRKNLRDKIRKMTDPDEIRKTILSSAEFIRDMEHERDSAVASVADTLAASFEEEELCVSAKTLAERVVFKDAVHEFKSLLVMDAVTSSDVGEPLRMRFPLDKRMDGMSFISHEDDDQPMGKIVLKTLLHFENVSKDTDTRNEFIRMCMDASARILTELPMNWRDDMKPRALTYLHAIVAEMPLLVRAVLGLCVGPGMCGFEFLWRCLYRELVAAIVIDTLTMVIEEAMLVMLADAGKRAQMQVFVFKALDTMCDLPRTVVVVLPRDLANDCETSEKAVNRLVLTNQVAWLEHVDECKRTASRIMHVAKEFKAKALADLMLGMPNRFRPKLTDQQGDDSDVPKAKTLRTSQLPTEVFLAAGGYANATLNRAWVRGPSVRGSPR